MEVVSFFTDKDAIHGALGNFLQEHPGLRLTSRDEDTLYFEEPVSGRNEVRYPLKAEDIEKEFAYNFTPAEQADIKAFFKGNDYLLFYVEFRQEAFARSLLETFISGISANPELLGSRMLILMPQGDDLRFELN